MLDIQFVHYKAMSAHYDILRQRLSSGTARVGVMGLGYVGLPLAVELARGGYAVTGFDTDASKVEMAARGESYIRDVETHVLTTMVDKQLFSATTDFSLLSSQDAVSICVPTPLSKTRDPDMSYIAGAVEELLRYLPAGRLVVLESTTYPGTTHEFVLPRFESHGWKAGEDIFVAFSPERVDPGNPEYNTRNTPKVVGGVTGKCRDLAVLLYSRAVERVVPVSSATTAEMVKLLENTFRAVNIGLINEMALMCDRLGVDVWEVIEAAGTKPFGFMTFKPGPGLGGHCIPVDPQYLSWKLKLLKYRARFIELAADVNSEMPGYVVSKIVDGLNRCRQSVNGARILILGVAYKRDVGDVRESPAMEIIELLRSRGGDVIYNDPHVPSLTIDSLRMESQPLTAEALQSCHCVVVVTDHAAYDWEFIISNSRLLVDTRNVTKGRETEKIVRL